MEKKLFGTMPTGEEVYSYTLKNDDASLSIMTRGATILDFCVFGRSIIGGFDTLEGYLKDTSHQGAIIGRVANRIKNATFSIGNTVYLLPKNNNGHCLHGGCGFDYKIWEVVEAAEDHITLTYTSRDGEEGFPSELKVTVTYRLCGASFLIDYVAIPEGKTPISLTNHAYFNLDGFGGTIKEHNIAVYAGRYTAVDEELIPTGERPSVEGTVFDLRSLTPLGKHCSEDFIGYDHNFVLDADLDKEIFGKTLRPAAVAVGKDLIMRTYTDQDGVQLYMGNFMGKPGSPLFRGGVPMIKHGAFCLETQSEPNSVNRGVGIYDKGEVYRHSVVYAVEKL